MRVIAFFSQKGGVGKTTASVNIAVALAQMGRRVLLIDLDSNACASAYLGVSANLESSVGAALLRECRLPAVTKPVADGVWLVPGSSELVTIDKDLAREAATRDPAYALVEALSALDATAYDYVLLDCPGGHIGMGQMALMAADEVIIPTGLSVLDLYAAVPTLGQIRNAQEFRADGGRPTLLGFLPNGASKAGVPAKLQALLDQYGLPCFTPVRASALLKTAAIAAQMQRRCLVLSRPDSPVSVSYRQVAREIDLGIAVVRADAAGALGAGPEADLETGQPEPMTPVEEAAPEAGSTADWPAGEPSEGEARPDLTPVAEAAPEVGLTADWPAVEPGVAEPEPRQVALADRVEPGAGSAVAAPQWPVPAPAQVAEMA
jgi:chromosome partitioning protein